MQILSNGRGISKCYYDVQTHPWVSEVSCRCFALFAFFVQILVAATEQGEVPDAHPASHGSRQTGRPSAAAVSVCSASSLRVVSLSASNHVGHAAGYQKKKGCENTVVDKMIPEDHDRTNNFLQASPCPSRLAGDVSVLRQGGRISHGGFGVSL